MVQNLKIAESKLLPASKKHVLPTFYQSNIIYQFLCHCDSRYVGRTFQRLQQRIKQHMPKTILQEHISQDQSTLARSCKPIRSLKAETSFSAIEHLLQNPTCAHEYNDNKFSIFACGRTSFHLSTLEATYIKTSQPNLCKQKEFLYGLKITHWFPLLLLVASFTNHDELFPFFLFRQLCLYISDSLHLFTLFVTDSLEKLRE